MKPKVQACLGQLIVSCQAYEDTPLYGAETMKKMVQSAMLGGAQAVRCCWPQDIRAARSLSEKLIIIGINKVMPKGEKKLDDVFITPTFEKARGEEIPEDLITSIKSALMGPFAGIGDALLPGTFIPILLAIACGLSADGQITGAIFYMIVFLAVMVPLTWFLFNRGVAFGAKAAELILGNDLKDDIISALNIVGLMVVGCIACAYANINLGFQYVKDGVVIVDLQSLINGVWPKLPVFLAALGTYYLMAKKNWSATKMILLYLVIAILGYFSGILTV